MDHAHSENESVSPTPGQEWGSPVTQLLPQAQGDIQSTDYSSGDYLDNTDVRQLPRRDNFH